MGFEPATPGREARKLLGVYFRRAGSLKMDEQTLAVESISRFLSQAPALFKTDWPAGSDHFGVGSGLSGLAAFEAEFSFHLADVSAVARRLSEWAFSHLQRNIVADDDIRLKWMKAFHKDETACEKLGSVHLLSHGILAFKAGAAGENRFADGRADHKPAGSGVHR